MSNKYWEILLIKWRERGQDGLTIPFIIGSQKYLPTQHSHQEIEGLIVDIATSNGTEIYVSYCMNIKEIILGVRDNSKKAIVGHFPPFEGQNQTKLFLTSFVSDLGNDVKSVAWALKEHFQGHIDSANFSKRNGEWTDYSGKDSAFIKDCFNSINQISFHDS